MVLLRESQELVDSLGEALRVLLPNQVVQEYAHRVHADAFRPPKLLVDTIRVEAFGLPHLDLIDGGRGDEIRSHEPGLLRVPSISLLLRPACLLSEDQRTGQRQQQK